MHSTRIARLFAAAVDVVLAVLIAVAAALRRAADDAVAGLPVQPIAIAAVCLFALRDVPSGASLAKWLLGLRLETPGGARPGVASRLLRAPWSVLPLAWLFPALERRTPWRVVAYAPSAAGLVTRLTLAAVAVAAGGIAAFTTLRPAIGRDDAVQLAHATLGDDPLLQRELGVPITIELGTIAPRRTLRDGAVFAVAAHGPRGHQNMTVVARRVGDTWAIEERFDIETVVTDSSAWGEARGR